MDVIKTLRMKDRYNIFKAVLIDRLAPSSRLQTNKLLQGMKLDKRSPSEAFEAIHNQSDQGAKATSKLLTARYVWPNVRKDVRQWCKVCME